MNEDTENGRGTVFTEPLRFAVMGSVCLDFCSGHFYNLPKYR